ncbi:MAG: transcriptional regulator NrdR [Coriobacteriia bacterium]|nr:transcriptional regulator NrdR [Coriobacteriia bacterium]MBS5478480.1 transcriptional regulator NrdR [Coriobacteriia bacterium]
MRCPKCGFEESRVIDSRPSESGDAIRRRRECLNPSCKERFTTYERREELPLQVRKKNGMLEAFDREKLMKSLVTATVKRNVSVETLNELISSIESELRNAFKTEVTSRELGDMVLRRLLLLDRVAYVRFASVYRDFKDLEGFYNELAHIGEQE